MNRQIREVIIGLPEISFDDDGIEESIPPVAKARSDEEREEVAIFRQAFEKTDQLSEARRFLGSSLN